MSPILPQSLQYWWTAIAPICTRSLTVSTDLGALLQRAWERSPNARDLPIRLGQIYEADLGTSQRRRRGSYYTPEAIAQFMVTKTVGPARGRDAVPTVLDPACGGGIFLVTAYRHLAHSRSSDPTAEMRLLRQLFGVDIDANAVAVTRLALGLTAIHYLGQAVSPSSTAVLHALDSLSRTIRCGNALVLSSTPPEALADSSDPSPFPFAETRFAVVLGNPPYLDSEAMVKHLPHWRAYYSDRYQTAQGNWDLFCVFIERALQLCCEGGWHSFVVPNKLLSAEYATQARSLLGRYKIHCLRDYSRARAFEAAVYPVVYIVETVENATGEDAGKVCYESMETLDQPSETSLLCPSRLSTGQPWCLSSKTLSWRSRLGEGLALQAVATVVGAASVSEAYQIQSLIHEPTENSASNALRVVNSGTIDRYVHHWGRKPLRYLGDRYSCPVVSRSALAAALPKRHRQATSPKIIVAGLTRQLECIWDEAGTLMAGKSTTLILPQPHLPYLGPLLLGILNSALLTLYFRALFGGNALQGGYLRVGPPQMRSLPLPPGYPWSCPPSEVKQLVQLVDQRQRYQMALEDQREPTSAQRSPMRSLQALDYAIDALVYQLYGISEDDATGPHP